MSKYPKILFYRNDEDSYIDDFITKNIENFNCSIEISRDTNKLFNPNYHVFITFGDNQPHFENFPHRFSPRWIHTNKEFVQNIERFNSVVNYNYIHNIVNLKRETSRPVFSIFTTCYNTYNKFLRVYNSVKTQKFSDWEWVILDDSESQEHFEFLKKFTKDDHRIRLFQRGTNSGNIGCVKNEAVSLCRGKYVLELDHDDEILPDCLKDAVYEFQNDPGVGFVYMDFANLYENGKPFQYPEPICKGYGGYYWQYYKNNWIPVYITPNINNITLSQLYCCPNHPRIWRKDVLLEYGNYSEYLPICDDFEILLKTLTSKYKVVKINKLAYIQYMNNDGNNFSLIRNKEINRLGPNHISPMFHKKTNLNQTIDEDNGLFVWHRETSTRKNTLVNRDFSHQKLIIGADNLPTDTGNCDILVLDNKRTDQELMDMLPTNVKFNSKIGFSEIELQKYFKFLYKNDNCDHEIVCGKNKSKCYIIHNNKKGGVHKYVLDIIRIYPNYDYIFIDNRKQLLSIEFNKDDLFLLQNVLYTDIEIDDIIAVHNFKLIISIHDFIWLCQEQYEYTHDIPSSYLKNNISIAENVKTLLSLADKVIMNSQFTYDVYSKYFETSNFIISFCNDYKIQHNIKNTPKIENNCINIGVFSPKCKYKGEEYINYLKDKYENEKITFKIVGIDIPFYKETEFYDYIRKYNINGFLLLNKWGETYSYLLTKSINSGLPLLYNNTGSFKERIPPNNDRYFKVFDEFEEINYSKLDNQFLKFIEYINTNNGRTEKMNEDFTIVTTPVYDELFIPSMKIPKHIFQTSKETLPSHVNELINIYCPEWNYSHFIDKECIDFFRTNPITEFPNIVEKFHSFTQGQHKADLFRYYYLYLRGGVFLDSDAMFETNIEKIIQDYNSVFAKSYMENEHLFNGFIATYPRNEIIYNALKHAYNTENETLQSNYHYFCEELLRIVNAKDKQNTIIYQEYSDTIDSKGVGRFKNGNEETVFIHYWQNREIPSNLLKLLYPYNKNFDLNNNIWCFYIHENYELRMIESFIDSLNSIYQQHNIYLTNDKDIILKYNPSKLTFIMDINKSLIHELPNTQFSILNLEPLNIPVRLNNVRYILNLYPNFKYYDYSKSNLKILEENGFDINDKIYLPYKCIDSELKQLVNLNKNTEKKFDFGIIKSLWGDVTDRRLQIVNFLKKHNFTVNIIGGWGDDRDIELAKCKTILNIHGFWEIPSFIFEHIRCDRLLEAGFNVLSETSYKLDKEFVDKYPNLEQIEYNDFFKLID